MQICARMGEKQPGNQAHSNMRDFIADQFKKAGLEVKYENFNMPIFKIKNVSAELLSPSKQTLDIASFSYGGTGDIKAEIVDVKSGRPENYNNLDVEGKIVLVQRDVSFHRTAQYDEAINRGAAMLYISGAPNNLKQIGSVRFASDIPGSIPAVSIGSEDGKKLRDILNKGPVKMHLVVDAERVNEVATNVLGTKKGKKYPDNYIIVGAHYDSWFNGAVDNCSAVGSMIQMAYDVAKEDLAYTVIFAGWDAEETGLVGAYDWVKKIKTYCLKSYSMKT
ncbi:M28 family peptidase [Neisseriaceae bacterium PsAf]|nr:M28 family peptidase [Neisseriaceae bacterium PsAf]